MAVAVVLCLPVGGAQPGPFQSFAAVDAVDSPGEIVPGTQRQMVLELALACRPSGSPQVDAEQFDLREEYQVSVSADQPWLEVGNVTGFEVDWGALGCFPRHGTGPEMRHEHVVVPVRFLEGTPAFMRATVNASIQGEWGHPTMVWVQLLALPTGSVHVSVPEAVELTTGAENVVPVTVVNDMNAPARVVLDPLLRGLRGPQPDVPPFVLLPGASTVVNVTLVPDDPSGAVGVLDLRYVARSTDGVADVLDEGGSRVALVLGEAFSPSSKDVHEAPVPPVAVVLSLLGFLALRLRRL